MAASAWNAAPAVARDLLGDERLARLAARGDERAFGTLYERYRPDLERYCRSILRNGADAEDAAQNAMVAALRALEAGTIPMRVKPWLYRIAHNEAISLARRRRPVEDIDDQAIAASAGPEEASDVRERLGQLMTDLKSLTERQREALVLRELFGLSYTEIAGTLGSNEAAAMQTVFEARSALMVFGEGRALDCQQIQRAMSDCDGNRLRSRRFRAHVRDCRGCREFESSLLARRRELGLLFPPAGGAGLLAGLARILGLGAGGRRLIGAFTLKGAALGAALLAGTGALVVATQSSGPSNTGHGRIGQPTGGVSASAAPAAPVAATHTAGHTTVTDHRATHRHGATHHTTGATHPSAPGAHAPATTPTASGGGAQGANANEVASADTGSSSGGGTDRGRPGTGTSGPVPGHSKPAATVNQAVDQVGQTVDGTVNQVSGTVNQVTGDAGAAVDQVTTTATGAVDQTTTTATGIIKKTTGIGLP